MLKRALPHEETLMGIPDSSVGNISVAIRAVAA
jgi:hypothetical protein